MNDRDRRYRLRASGLLSLATVTWLATVVLHGQGPTDRPPMAEDVFKNVQVLRGIPVNDFMGTMGIFSAALGMSCEDCHRSGDASWENYAAESPRKQMARAMVVMMATINKVLDRFIAAAGGAARVGTLTSFTATGISVGYGPDSEKRLLVLPLGDF